LEPEPADRPETLDRRRREDGDKSTLNGSELLLQIVGYRQPAELRCRSFFKRLQRRENDARVGTIREPIDRQPRKRDCAVYRWMLETNLAHLPDDAVSAIQ